MSKCTKKVLCVGLTCLDIIQTCTKFPLEDSDQRSLEARWQRGGNASNNCTVLSQLGVFCEYLGTLGQDLTLEFLLEDFSQSGIDIGHCVKLEGGKCPVSTVLLSAETGSRTIVHHAGTLPELSPKQFASLNIQEYCWVHFEGRNPIGVASMLQHLDSNKIAKPKTSVELEKPKQELDILLPLADVVFLGKDYVLGRGWKSAEVAVTNALLEVKEGATVVCAWGLQGAWAQISGDSHALIHSPAFPPHTVVDSLGAGDTFVAAMIAGLHAGNDLEGTLKVACQLAGIKVGLKGLKCNLGSMYSHILGK